MSENKSYLSCLPSLEKFSRRLKQEVEFQTVSTPQLTALAREAVDALRKELLNDRQPDLDSKDKVEKYLLNEVEWLYHRRLQAVVNGTGIVLHTNMGRSLLAKPAQIAVQNVAGHYCNLEYDLHRGARGSRHTQISKVLKRLLNVDGAMVVNNNAAGTFLTLNTLAEGKEVIISRGQLVEIGGSFRMPDVFDKSRAIMREVGTTNKTHLSDYENAITENTAAIIEVHTSNYRIRGFTESVPLAELAALGKKHNLPVISDLGSGVLIDLSQYGMPKEPMVQESLATGADVVMFSGDKLLGGPQAGIIVGKKQMIAGMKKNPFTRMFRCDKMTLAALEATLELYFEESTAIREIPTLNQITRTAQQLNQTAKRISKFLQRQPDRGFQFELIDGFSEVGGGSLPLVRLPTTLIAISSKKISANRLEHSLRQNRPPIIGRIQQDRFLLDPRTLSENDERLIAEALNRL